MRVLVIEDYTPLRNSLVRGLREADLNVDASGDGDEGLWLAESSEYDVIVLDLMLPGMDGLTILNHLRDQKNRAQVLILTAKDSIADRVAGLDRGADDYLVKPFAFAELLARVHALVRRKYGTKSAVIEIDDVEIDTHAHTVCRKGQAIELTSREYRILEYLAVRRNHVVTRTEIWNRIYDMNAEPNSNVIDVYIGTLRRKLESDNGQRLIHTRRGLGYVLSAKP